MSLEASTSINVNAYRVMGFYAENILDRDVVIFNKETIRFDKLKENGQVEIEKITNDFQQVITHEVR